ncbi:MAG TPA: phosphate ABC transporter permease subunit PstC [Herpetosiphonaceae bacterium]
MAQFRLSERTTAWQRVKQRTQHGDTVFKYVTMFFAFQVIALVVLIGAVVWIGSAQARSYVDANFLFVNAWNPVNGREKFGALAAVYGTVMSALIALALAGPIGVLIGVFLSELCPRRLRTPLSFLIELLAAIPSVIYGLWGALVLGPFIQGTITKPLAERFSSSLQFLASPAPKNLLVAGIILGIMILPTIASITRDVLVVVPNHQREAMLALGSTRWEMIWKSVLPYSKAGIVGGIMLGLGRALGETLAATMVIGNKMAIASPVKPAQTAASLIANQLPNANGDLHASALILIALVLFSITLFLNALARLLVWRVSRGPAGAIH